VIIYKQSLDIELSWRYEKMCDLCDEPDEGYTLNVCDSCYLKILHKGDKN